MLYKVCKVWRATGVYAAGSQPVYNGDHFSQILDRFSLDFKNKENEKPTSLKNWKNSPINHESNPESLPVVHGGKIV